MLETALSAALLMGTAGVASAQIIGAQFANGTVYTGTGLLGESFVDDSLGAATGQGINAQGGATFPSSMALGSSGVTLTVNTPDGGQYISNRPLLAGGTLASEASDLYSNALEVRQGSPVNTFTFSGLTAGASYIVDLYAGNFGTGDSDPFSVVFTGGTAPITTTITGAFDAPTMTLGDNAATSGSITADALGDIVVTTTASTASSHYNPINGIGIAASAIPEPSSWAMVVAGAGALVGFQAFRRRTA